GLLAPRLVPDAFGKFDRAGGDAVDADALARKLGRLGAGVLDQGRLHRAVGRGAGARRQTGDRGDVDDRCAGPQGEVRERRPTGAHGAEQVDLDAGRPAGFVVAATEAGGVVDQYVDAAESGDRRPDVAGDAVRIGQVAAGRMD